MNYRLLTIGILFLFNPEITVFDILPDAIGFLCMAKALLPLAPISPSAESAMSCFRKLALVSAIKAFAFFPMMSLYSTEKEVTLLFTAGFAILTSIYLFPAFSNLFTAFSFLATRENTVIRYTGLVKLLTYAAFLLRYFLAMVPESVYLYVDTYQSMTTGHSVYPLAPYRTSITVLSVTLSLVIGSIWLTAILCYLRGMKQNLTLNQGIAKAVTEVVHTKAQTVLSSVRPTITLLSVAFLTMIGYSFDGLPIFPSFLPPLLMLIAFRLLKRSVALTKRFTVLPALSTALGFVSWLANWLFCEMYYDKASVGFVLVKEQFLVPVIFEWISTIFLIVTLLFCFLPAMLNLVDEHCGVFWETAYLSHNSVTAKERHRQAFSLKLASALSAICAIFHAVSFTLYYSHPILRLLGAAFGVALFLFCRSLFSSILQSVKEKYADGTS